MASKKCKCSLSVKSFIEFARLSDVSGPEFIEFARLSDVSGHEARITYTSGISVASSFITLISGLFSILSVTV